MIAAEQINIQSASDEASDAALSTRRQVSALTTPPRKPGRIARSVKSAQRGRALEFSTLGLRGALP